MSACGHAPRRKGELAFPFLPPSCHQMSVKKHQFPQWQLATHIPCDAVPR